jgi:predicted flap endonuclease-1-like 5' DNA nuclease
MALFLQIVVFLIVAAALGFAIGWLVRGARLQGEGERLAGDWRTRLGQVEAERDRLQNELAAARTERSALERAPAERSPELEERAARLQQELEAARQATAEQRAQREAEVGRLEARIAELQAGARTAHDAPLAAGTSVNARAVAPVEGAPPPALPGPEGAPDDLKRISGIGPGIEKTLHELGIYHFRQIARFTPENVAWVNQRLRFKGRIEREDWIGQARTLDGES